MPLAQHADAVRVVHHDPRAVPLADFDQRRQRGDVAAHAVHAIHNHQLARVLRELGQGVFQAVGVVVREAAHPRLVHAARHEAAIHNAGVIVLVQDGEIAAPHNGRDRAEVGLVAGGENNRRLFAHKLGQPVVQFQVEGQRTVEEAAAGAACPEPFGGLNRGPLDFRVRRQAQVVVRPDHHHFFALEGSRGGVGVLQRLEERVHAHLHRFAGTGERARLVENVLHDNAIPFLWACGRGTFCNAAAPARKASLTHLMGQSGIG